VCYLKQPVSVNRGDTIRGTIALRRNPRNLRNVDIQIDFTYGSWNYSNSYSFWA
jgi:hypothetical protein